MTAVLGSCASILSLLQEDDDQLKIAALRKLNEPGVVEMFWTEIADNLVDIEILHEDDQFLDQKLAALVAAKVYYYLDEPDEALRLALRAGELFDPTQIESPFVKAIMSYCIDKYIKEKSKKNSSSITESSISRAAVSAIEADDIPMQNEDDDSKNFSKEDNDAIDRLMARLHQQCVDNNELTYALGIAFESLDIEKVESLLSSPNSQPRLTELLGFCFDQAPQVIVNHSFRGEVMKVVLKKYAQIAHLPEVSNPETPVVAAKEKVYSAEDDAALLPVTVGLASTLLRLNDSLGAAKLLVRLVNAKHERKLHHAAIQIAFDFLLADQAPFLFALVDAIKGEKPSAEEEESGIEIVAEESPENERTRRVVEVLTGAEWARISLQLLAKANKTDLGLFDRLKASQTSAIHHNAIVLGHAFAQAGTTQDAFLRVNMKWLGDAQCWNKFAATASIGVVHAGQADSKKVLSQYLPPAGATQPEGAAATTRSSYSEAGAFYALGLIHANAPSTPEAISAREYLLQQLKDNHSSEIRLHGACLGLGLLCVGLHDPVIYEALKTVLYTDMAVAGEAAALAIGLLMQGSAHQEAIDALFAYCHESSHEKIVRACSLALGLIVFNVYGSADAASQKHQKEGGDGEEGESISEDCKKRAEILCSKLLADKDASVRYGGALAIGLAYAGTSSLTAQQTLLRLSVSDVSEDVRRGAVVALGFVLAVPTINTSNGVTAEDALVSGKSAAKVVESLKLICENYSFHVRYGAALALGISCAGTFSKEASELLLKMRSDPHDVVRQAASIALGLVLMNAPSPTATLEKPEDEAAKTDSDAAKSSKKKKVDEEKEKEEKEALAKKAALLPFAFADKARAELLKAATDKKESQISKMGATIGLGLLNAAGRNGTTGFVVTSPPTYSFPSDSSNGTPTEVATGQVRFRAASGLFLLSQLWYWFPLTLGASLAIRPSLIVGVTEDLKVPAKGFEIRSAARKERMAYPSVMKKEEKAKLEKTATAQLSVSKPKADDADVAMDADGSSPVVAVLASPTTGPTAGVSKKYESLTNGSRILPSFADSIIFSSNSRFSPLFYVPKQGQTSLAGTTAPIRYSGPIVLFDSSPDTEAEFERLDTPVVKESPSPAPAVGGDPSPTAGAPTSAEVNGTTDEEEESLPLPEDFEWDGN